MKKIHVNVLMIAAALGIAAYYLTRKFGSCRTCGGAKTDIRNLEYDP